MNISIILLFVQIARLEKEGKLERAVECYREALADDPSQQTARTRLELIIAALEKQVGITSVMWGTKCVLWIFLYLVIESCSSFLFVSHDGQFSLFLAMGG